MKVDLQVVSYNAEKKGDVKRLRKQGKIPAVLYGHGEKTKEIYVEVKDFKKILELMKKETVTVNLKLKSKGYVCVIKSVQHNPVTGALLHIDFQHIHKEEKIKALVPIHPIGEAPGIEQGGILDVHLHEVVVRCLPDDMPSHIDIDVSSLDLGQTIHLKDIKLPNIDFELVPETTVISILTPRKVEVEVKPEVVEEAVGEGEEEKVEKEKKEGKEEVKEEKKEPEEKQTKGK